MCSLEKKCTPRVVVLTGGAQGIGRSCAEAFLQRGDKVIFGDVSITKGQDVEKELEAKYGAENVTFKPCDIRKDDDVTALFDDCIRIYGQPGILCCVAGIIDEESWTNTVEVNLNGTIRCCYAGIRHMSKENGHNGGVVVMIGSVAAYGLIPFMPVYCATKAGIIAIARNYASSSSTQTTSRELDEMTMVNSGSKGLINFHPFEVVFSDSQLQCGDRLYTSESDVYRRHILTYKDGPRTARSPLHYVPSGVQFSVVCPSLVDTPMGLEVPNDQYKVVRTEDLRKIVAHNRGNPLRPEYVARAVLGCTDKPELNGKILEVLTADGVEVTKLVHFKDPETSPFSLD